MKNRLSEYFAELDEIAKTNPAEALALKNKHLSVFDKKTPFDSCTFSSNISDSFSGIFIADDGKAYDFNGKPIDLEDDDETEWWKK